MAIDQMLGMTIEEFQANQQKLPASIIAKLLNISEKTVTSWAESKGMPANPRSRGAATYDWNLVREWYIASQQGSRKQCAHCGR